VATVDHGLRDGSLAEAELVAAHCRDVELPHAILPISVEGGSSLQHQARKARYRALGQWAQDRGLAAVATAHHRDDQAETLLLRLARGSGLSGLAGIRARRSLASGVDLIRPLLGWSKSDLVQIVAEAGWVAVDDPSNRDPRHDRTAVRRLLEREPSLDPARLSRSADALAEAEESLRYVLRQLARERIEADGAGLTVRADDLPRELRRRLLLEATERLGASGPSGPELDRALDQLANGRSCTLRGLLLDCRDNIWRLGPEPPRTPRS